MKAGDRFVQGWRVRKWLKGSVELAPQPADSDYAQPYTEEIKVQDIYIPLGFTVWMMRAKMAELPAWIYEN